MLDYVRRILVERHVVDLNMTRRKEAALCAAIGGGGALVFLFAFPRGAISTLMHEVLHLPGPGAGIALIFGPFLALVALTSFLSSRGKGGSLIAALTFGLSYALVVWLFRIPTNPKGAFGSILFVAAVALFGLAVESVMALARAFNQPWRCLLAGAVANVVLLVFYWLAIFPRTAGWVKWKDIPLLLGVCLVGGLVPGYIAWTVSRLFPRALAHEQKE
jgi:membrane-bound metal-dependent hydrolase YbcI (DUF457 family)